MLKLGTPAYPVLQLGLQVKLFPKSLIWKVVLTNMTCQNVNTHSYQQKNLLKKIMKLEDRIAGQ